MKDRVEAARLKAAGRDVGVGVGVAGWLGSPQAGRPRAQVAVPPPSSLSH